MGSSFGNASNLARVPSLSMMAAFAGQGLDAEAKAEAEGDNDGGGIGSGGEQAFSARKGAVVQPQPQKPQQVQHPAWEGIEMEQEL